ncbi:MAG: imidazolonepropionase [Pyrinomonadaceae bacterium]|nr:imidazolonepropionase [Pyrinomonadaceae bacterium]
MKQVDLIISNIGQLITCAAREGAKKGIGMRDLGIVEDGAVAVEGKSIVGVDKSGKILAEFESENVLDASGRSVSPGFVDPHTHIVFGGDRFNEFELRIKGASYLEIMEAGGGIVSTVAKTRAASIRELASDASERLDVMLELGATTVEIKTGYGLDFENEIKMLEVIEELDKNHQVDVIPTFLAAHAIPADWKGREDEFTDLICRDMIPAAWDWYKNSHFSAEYPATEGTENTEKEIVADKTSNALTQSQPNSSSSVNSVAKFRPFFIDVFCEKNAFNLKQSKKVINTAKELGFAIKAHVDEFTNLGCAEFAIENGATSIDHLDATSNSEIDLLANSETIGVVTPTVNFNLGSGEFADARNMIDRGCAIALSTDYNPGSAPCPSQPVTMAIACRYQKLLPSEALNAVTINAAHAIGLGKTHGSIEVGKRADLLVFGTEDYRQIAYEFGRNLVFSVIKSGKRIF